MYGSSKGGSAVVIGTGVTGATALPATGAPLILWLLFGLVLLVIGFLLLRASLRGRSSTPEPTAPSPG